MSEEIMVSVVCNAYNHAPYIRACLDGLLSQRASFPYELLVHDDASTDGTADIIREYEARFPGRLKPIYQTENQYRQGGVMRFQIPRAKGRYIALCEGDDYWTDPLKLQKQVDAMEAHPEIDLCAHASSRIDGVTGQFISLIAPSERDTVFTPEAVIAGGGLFVATSSLLFRVSLNDDVPTFRQRRKTDYTLQIHGSLRGGMLYLADNMSIYRFKTPGSWSMRQNQSLEAKRSFTRRVTDMLNQLDEDTGGRYHAVVARRVAEYEFQLCVSRRDFKGMLGEPCAAYYADQPLGRRCAIRLCAAMPWAYDLWKRFEAALPERRAGSAAKREEAA